MARIKKQTEEIKEKRSVSLDDIFALQKMRMPYRQQRIGGVLFCPTEQWLWKVGVIKIEDGNIIVCDPNSYTFWRNVDEARKSYEYNEVMKTPDRYIKFPSGYSVRIVHRYGQELVERADLPEGNAIITDIKNSEYIAKKMNYAE